MFTSFFIGYNISIDSIIQSLYKLGIMGKLKTRHSAKKRFRKTVNGNFIRRRAFKGHLLEKKSAKRKRALSHHMTVSFGDSLALRSMLPYL